MAPGYCLNIGGAVFDGRDDEYLPATAAQLDQFPGLNVTVHDVVIGENAIAMCFTEHGSSIQDEGRRAAWSGITFFFTDGERFVTGWAEEEYIARKRQLTLGQCEAIEPSHIAPWDIQARARNPENEALVRQWIAHSHPLKDIPNNNRLSPLDPDPEGLVDIRGFQVNALFSAGDRVVVHAQYHGIYAGGFGDLSPLLIGCQAGLRLAAIVTIVDGEIIAARITTDRLGLSRALRGMT